MRRAALAATLAALAAGCGGAAEDEAAGPRPAPAETAREEAHDEAEPHEEPAESLVHVHGLAVNPADGALYVATHTGLWRIAAEGAAPERVGETRRDLMGFTVVGPDRFIASGHPEPGADEPNPLGVVVSEDGGRSWRTLALAGEADLHALEATGTPLLYGYDVTARRLLASPDGGRTWQQRDAPAPLVDLAAHPTEPRRLVASGEDALYVSDDEGVSWSRLTDGAGLLAWPDPDRLYLVGPDGSVWLSGDGGRDWDRVGTIGGAPAALAAAGPRELVAATAEAAITRSTDGGRSWTVLARPETGG